MSEDIEHLDFDHDEEEARRASRSHLPDFVSLARSVLTDEGVIDLSIIDKASEGPGPTNGGIRCDVSEGPYACGAWH